MKWLADTNILLRSLQTSHPMFQEVADAISILWDRGDELCILAQNLIEFWSVATRPVVNNGLGLTITRTALELAKLKQSFPVLPETDEILREWERLVVIHQVHGRQVYDARLVAAMEVHNLTHLITFNGTDFKRFTRISAVSPAEILLHEQRR